MNNRLIIVLTLFLAVAITPLSAKTVRIKANKPLQQQFTDGDVVYKISDDIDLKGSTLKIPDGATIRFCRGGALSNGTVSGSFSLKGVRQKSFRVQVQRGSRILGKMPVYNHTPGVNVSVLSACTGSIILMSDIVTDSDVSLFSSVDGRGHTITASSKAASVLRITDYQGPGIVIEDLEIKRDYSGAINTNYALLCENSSNISIMNSSLEGRLRFVNKTFSDSPGKTSHNFRISGCTLTCDLSSCPQGWEWGQDHISFYSVKDIVIEKCKIVSTNVNRILKTSQYFSDKDYTVVNHCSDNILFQNNSVIGRCTHGKQMWDMYCGTTNVTIEGNSFDLKGFTRFVEDKAYQDKYDGNGLVSSHIRILNNNVKTFDSDLFQFRASSCCDNFEVIGNTFVMCGRNANTLTGYERSCGGYLQGYRSAEIRNNSFTWEDEAINLFFLKVNYECGKTVIENNRLVDVYRINITSAKHPVSSVDTPASGSLFRYSGNKKQYSPSFARTREELYVADMKFDSLDVEFEDNDLNESYEMVFSKNATFDSVNYKTKALKSKSFLKQGETVRWKAFQTR